MDSDRVGAQQRQVEPSAARMFVAPSSYDSQGGDSSTLEESSPTTLTVVVECATVALASASRVRENLLEIARQIAALSPPDVGEIVLVSSEPVGPFLAGCRNVVVPGGGYYRLKNTGMRYARGRIVLFTDSDCRLAAGYLRNLLEVYSSDPGIRSVAGRTRYDGQSFLARLNTALSFGYLHDPAATTPQPYAALSHNISVRRGDGPDPLFGQYAGRVGGDRYLTDWYAKAGAPTRLVPALLVHHEDPSCSVQLLLDRHLREHFKHVSSGEPATFKSSAGRTALASAWRSLARRRDKLRRYGRFVGVEASARTELVLTAYWLLDVTAVTVLLASPPLARRWLAYQNGTSS